ncbi:hypothetical protein, unlikely [Trypanosoma brucei gambiense DAL972]|uniref:Uncharacterized protein n=1 Tax=Trypanosoma brucei gambiense (strain MHOM/CI/86/DAL972) TaxID=679716 RepID=C9ZN55_TRYB9|nr:hypothetical protein, unlikely [Trypanosoma brucei gambiense DAL972]CBH10709.1 hypothetical protein, unlikely [Trypanosoma brucei gambiense DAL972]|eukprot:XP_011772997.1 hypothetical protein, unlikely [Trypanosoma brucei gambiense DAL972]
MSPSAYILHPVRMIHTLRYMEMQSPLVMISDNINEEFSWRLHHRANSSHFVSFRYSSTDKKEQTIDKLNIISLPQHDRENLWLFSHFFSHVFFFCDNSDPKLAHSDVHDRDT